MELLIDWMLTGNLLGADAFLVDILNTREKPGLLESYGGRSKTSPFVLSDY